jgi:predicted ATPase
LLSLRGEQRYGALGLTPAQLRFRTIEVLVEQVLRLSRQRPMLMVLEDVHWIDPSMKDFIAELIPRVANQRVYLLVTYRPENIPDWSQHPHATSAALNRLAREQAAQIVPSVGGLEFIQTLTRRIVERADGVPL